MTRSIAAVTTVLAAVVGLLASPALAKDGEGEGFADMSAVLPNFLISAGILAGVLLLTALVAQATRKRAQAKAR